MSAYVLRRLPALAAFFVALLAGSAAEAAQVLTFPVASTTGWGTGGCFSSTERGTTTIGDALSMTWTDNTFATSATVTVEQAWRYECTGNTYTVSINGSAGMAGTLPAVNCVCNGAPYVTTSQTFTTGFAINPGGTNTLKLTHTAGGWQGVMDSGGWAVRVTVTPNVTTSFAVSGFPSPAVAGTAGSITVAARNNGVTDPGYRGTVHFTSTDAQAQLPADYTFTAADAGVHTFSSGVTLKTVGTSSVTVKDVAVPAMTGSQTGILVTPGPATTLVLTPISSPRTAGTASDVRVTARDAYGNLATGYRGTVGFSSSDVTATVPAAYTFTAADNGVHLWAGGLVLRTAGSQSFTVVDNADASLTATQAGIVVNGGTAASFVVSGIASPRAAGTPSDFTVEARDAFGNRATGYAGTVKLTTSDPAVPSLGTFVFLASDAGIHTFSPGVTFVTAGSRSLVVTDSVSSAIFGSQSGILVQPGAATVLAVTGIASPRPAGVSSDVVVEARDGYGNRATGYTGTVHFTSTDPAATLPADATFTAANGGIVTFPAGVVLVTAGSQSVRATDTATATLNGSTTVSVVAGAMAGFSVSGVSNPTTAGTAENLALMAVDAYGNRVNNYFGKVHFGSSDLQASLPADYQFLSVDSGRHVFTGLVVLRTSGTQSVTATDTANGSLKGAETGISVKSASAAALILSGIPSPVAAGTASDFTVEARDSYGNRALDYSGRLHFTSDDALATLPGDYVMSPVDQGLVHLSATFGTVGTRKIAATDTTDGTLSGVEGGIVVISGPVVGLSVAGLASPAVAGTAGSATVRAVDAYGNTATTYKGTVHFTSTDPGAVLPQDYAFAAADAGSHVFAVTLVTVGTQSVKATDKANAALNGTQSGLVVTEGPASQFAIVGLAPSATAGLAQSFSIEVRDAWGNFATKYGQTLSFTATDPAATLPGVFQLTPADGGKKSFSGALTWRTAGAQTLRLKNTGVVASANTNVLPAAAASFTVSGIPSPATAGVAATAKVTALDAFGNVDANYRGTVRVSSSDPQAALPATYTFSASDAGAASLPVTLKTAGSRSVSVVDASNAALNGSQTGILVHAAKATTFAFGGLPAQSVAGTSLDFTLSAVDAYGNVDPSFLAQVTFSSTDAQATVPPPHAFTADEAGTRAFPAGAVLRTAGKMKLHAAAPGLEADSPEVLVTPAAAVGFALAGVSEPLVAGAASPLAVRARDAFGNTATNYSGTVHFSSSDGRAVLPTDQSFASAVGGILVLADALTLKTAGEQTLTATDTTNAAMSGTLTVTVSPGAPAAVTLDGPSTAIAGVDSAFAVVVRDAFGNQTLGATALTIDLDGSETATLADVSLAGSGASGTHAVGASAADGTASFSVHETTAGSLTACVTAPTVVDARACLPLTVGPAAPDHVTLVASSAHATAGQPVTVTAMVRDAFENVAPAAVALKLAASGQGSLADGGALTTAEGLGTAALDDRAAETITVSVASATVGGTELPQAVAHGTAIVTFGAGAADHAIVLAPPATVAGVPATVTVQAADVFGNPTTGAIGVCVSVTGAQGGAPTVVPNALESAPTPSTGTVCGTTQADGHGTVDVTDTKAENVAVAVASTGLAGSGSDVGGTVSVLPAARDHLRVSAREATALACGKSSLDLQVVDRFDNAVVDGTGAVSVTVTVQAPSGHAQIAETTLAGATTLPATEVTGTTGQDGSATVGVSLDAKDQLSATWKSSDLPGDPASSTPATISFVAGAASAENSTFVAAGTQVESGWGSVKLTLTPRDACGVLVGTGHDVQLTAPTGKVSAATDVGDGSYTATFSTEKGECPPEPIALSATVDGVPVGTTGVRSVCSEVDPKSVVGAPSGDVLACASQETWATFTVTPKGTTGLDFPPGQAVTIDADGKLLVQGPVTSSTDDAGVTTYTVSVGSNRCSDVPREIPVKVNGVLLEVHPSVRFGCPPVDPQKAVFTAAPASALADGNAAAVVTVALVDTCGNPAFGRSVTVSPTNAALDVNLEAAASKLVDDLGKPDDGTVMVKLTSTQAGTTGLSAVSGEVTATSDAKLVTFTALPKVAGGCGCASGGLESLGGLLGLVILARRRRPRV